ncbi:MAG: hypothetical protein M0R03_17510, partial [Novosphingobium sp.]|nr:hypothetical protein [Novosphingobium sp.]
ENVNRKNKDLLNEMVSTKYFNTYINYLNEKIKERKIEEEPLSDIEYHPVSVLKESEFNMDEVLSELDKLI